MKKIIERVLMNGNNANSEVCARHSGVTCALFSVSGIAFIFTKIT